mgnify:CR=1 FL=1
MTSYYNENDRQAAVWLRELIAGGHIADGIVDERSITEIEPADLDGFVQCHFFAGIGGWSLALRLAGVPDNEHCWTGSCPCQPLSGAGLGKGHADERHLWPAFHRLIAVCRPATLYGEQVASHLGREWLAAVRADLEALGYACGAADLCAAGVGAPHIRQRLYFGAKRLANAGLWQGTRIRQYGRQVLSDEKSKRFDGGGMAGGLADAGGRGDDRPHAPDGFWRDADWLGCTDGKWRPVDSGLECLAHGISGRVGLLRGYGNAIVPQVAAAFIQAMRDVP